jgi:serine/threonine protein kinase
MTLLAEGQVIGKTYTVERYLGQGAFAEVYRVKHRFMGRQAMKVFKTAGLSMSEIEQTLEEALLLAQISHPNIIRVFEPNVVETAVGLCGFFTMEYVAGGSLEQFWKSFGMQLMPIETAIDIVRQACRGVAVAHSERPPVIHRDIKPQNLLVGYEADGLRVRVSDFGLAKRANPLTLLVSARGTRCFKSPETFHDFQSDSCAGDVWALGCTIYLLLTDRFPYAKSDQLELVDESTFENPLIPASQLNLGVDPGLDQIICRCLSINPKDRYRSARELLVELERWHPVTQTIKSQPGPSSEPNKTVLGPVSSLNRTEAYEMVERAKKLGRRATQLREAADLMEEAFNKWPELREDYEYQVQLWRKGIMN